MKSDTSGILMRARPHEDGGFRGAIDMVNDDNTLHGVWACPHRHGKRKEALLCALERLALQHLKSDRVKPLWWKEAGSRFAPEAMTLDTLLDDTIEVPETK